MVKIQVKLFRSCFAEYRGRENIPKRERHGIITHLDTIV